MTTLALIDFGSLFGWRYHANGDNAAAAKNECLGYVRGKLHEYDVVAVAIDSPPYRRKADFPDYKAQRDPWPAGAMELKRATIEEVGRICHVLGAEGYEADDIIATVVHQQRTSPEPPTVYSADKDLAQLCGHAHILKLDGTPHDLGGLRPELVPDYLALIGDSSDNLPGVDGIGKAKARALLEAFGDLDGISRATATEIQALPGFGPSVAGKLLAAWDVPPGELTPFDVRELVRLETDAPIDCSVLTIPTTPKEETMSEPTDEIPPPESTQPSQPQPVVHEAQPVSSQPRPATTRALASYDVSYSQALEPTSPETAWKYALHLFKSGMFKVRNPESAFAVIVAGRAYGLGAVEALMGMHLIEGKPTLSSGLIQALVQRSPQCEFFEVTEQSNERVTCVCKRKGRPEQSLTWTMEDAVRAGLASRGTWKSYPRAMLRARCIAELARTAFADVVHNCYAPDELGVQVDSPEAA